MAYYSFLGIKQKLTRAYALSRQRQRASRNHASTQGKPQTNMATVRKFFHLGWRCSNFTVNCYSLGQTPIKCLSLNWFWSSPLEKRLFSQVYRASVTRLPAISLFTNEDCHKRHEEQEALFLSFPLFCVATAVAFGFFLSYKSSVYAARKDECSKLSLTDIRAQRKRKKAVHMEKMRILRASRENEPPSKQLCQKDSEDEQVSKHFFFTV